jgi:hypothetical protein
LVRECSKELTVAAAESKGPEVYCTKCFQELGLHRAKLTVKDASSPKESKEGEAAAEKPADAAPAETAASS